MRSEGWYAQCQADALAAELLVGVAQPAQGGLVGAAQPVVEVDHGVVALHVLVQSVLQIPAAPSHKQRKRSGSATQSRAWSYTYWH